jgi:hypothetical protein
VFVFVNDGPLYFGSKTSCSTIATRHGASSASQQTQTVVQVLQVFGEMPAHFPFRTVAFISRPRHQAVAASPCFVVSGNADGIL